MKRTLVIPLLVAVALIGAIAVSSSGSGGYRVDAVFDTAKGMVPGQLVEIAGAHVGSVTAVKLIRPTGLASGYHALMELNVQRRFAPFHADASCQILPQGPISENYVECNPGTSSSGSLAIGPKGHPTVPVAHNSEALDVQDVLNVFTMPTDQRLGIMIDELGLGTAGQGENLNSIIRRANPSLDQANRLLGLLSQQRQQIGAAVTQTDQVLSSLAGTDQGVRQFVDRAAAVARTTAAHQPPLAASINRLPSTLAALDGGLRSINVVTAAGTPLLESLKTSAPGLLTLTRRLTDFSRAGTPALDALGPAARTGRAALTAAEPLVTQLKRFGTTAGTGAYLLDHLLTSARDSGFIEGALEVFYGITANDAAYDGVSHFLALVAQVFPQCLLTPTAPGCTSAFDSPGQGTVPANDPSAGAQYGWSPVPGGSPQAATARPAPQQAAPKLSAGKARALIDYLLGK